jgi:hypothetical protein
MRDVALPAAVLGADGVNFVVVGSLALRLHGEEVAVHDLDLVPAPGLANLQRLSTSMRGLAMRPSDVPSARHLAAFDTASVVTGWGPVDLLLQRGREDFDELSSESCAVTIAAIPVRVASREATLRLRRRFKGDV